VVSDNPTPELQVEPEVEPTEAPVGAVAVEETPETPEPSEETTPDPLQEALTRMGTIEESVARLAGLDPSRINPALGRISGMQSSIDELSKANPLADTDSRFAANETLSTALAQALINSETGEITETDKAALRSALAQTADARTTRDRETMKAELRAELQPASTEAPVERSDLQATVNTMRDQLIGYATAKGLEFSAVPAEVLQFQTNETLDVAFARVRTHIDGMASEDGAMDRLAERQGAASSAPSRAGGTTSLEDKKAQLEAGDLPMSDTASRAAIAAELGLQLAE